MSRDEKEYRVTVRRNIVIGPRKIADDVDMSFYIWAKTKVGAKKAFEDSGEKGEIVSVELIKSFVRR